MKKNKFEGFDAYDFLSISIPVALILNTVSVILYKRIEVRTMTKEEMLNLKLYECNKKRCGAGCNKIIKGCHLTHEVEYAVDPEQVLGFEALIRDQLDDCWHMVREKYLDVIVKANYYPDGAQTAAGIVGTMLDTNVQKNLEMLHNKMKEFEEESA